MDVGPGFGPNAVITKGIFLKLGRYLAEVLQLQWRFSPRQLMRVYCGRFN
jgi:hypothetical protein